MKHYKSIRNQNVLTAMTIAMVIRQRRLIPVMVALILMFHKIESQLLNLRLLRKKRQKDISDIDQKIISMYAKGMTTRQISDTLDDIYGFEASECQVKAAMKVNDEIAKDSASKTKEAVIA